MASEEEKILSIKVDYAEAIKAIADYQQKIDDLKESEKDLKKQLKDGQITQRQYAEEMAASRIKTQQYSESVRVLTKEVNNSIKSDRGKDTSLKGLRAALSNVTAEYDALSREERNSAKGKELQKHINEITSELKGAEEGTGRFYRNVGNYMNSIKGAFGTATQAVVGLGGQLKALMANPFILAIGIIASLINGIAKAIQSSEEQTNRWRMAIAPLNAILDILQNAMTKLAGYILDVIEGAGELWNWVMELTGAESWLGKNMREVNKHMAERARLERMQQEYTKASREEVVKSAEREREIAELRAKVAQRDKYSAKERLQFLDDAIEKETEQAKRRKELAQMNLEMLELESSFTENDAAMNDRLAEAKAAVVRADTDLFNKQRELNAQRAETINQMNAEAKAAEDAALKRMEEAAKRSSGMSDDEFNKVYAENERLAFAQIAMAKSVQETRENINKLMLKDAYATAMEEIRIQEEKADALRVVSGSIIELMEAVGDSNRAAAIAAKIVALAQIAIDTGVAISKAVATSASKGFWGFLAEVGPYIAVITANMAQAIKTIKSAKFSTGGDVSGEGTSTSDSIPAMLSDGESVMTAKATSMFAPILSAFNQAGGGVPIYGQQTGNRAMGEDMLAKSFAKGLAEMPAPVVSVEEINRVGNRVKVIENINRI